MTSILDWTCKVTEIPQGGLTAERSATSSELAAVANELGLLSIKSLGTRFKISAIAGGGYRLKGDIEADAEQSCIVSLEPVRSKIAEPFDVELRQDQPATPEEGEIAILAGHDEEDFDGKTIPVGRIVFETFSASLDPYPRKADAEFSWRDDVAEKSENKGPFSPLSKLKSDL